MVASAAALPPELRRSAFGVFSGLKDVERAVDTEVEQAALHANLHGHCKTDGVRLIDERIPGPDGARRDEIRGGTVRIVGVGGGQRYAEPDHELEQVVDPLAVVEEEVGIEDAGLTFAGRGGAAGRRHGDIDGGQAQFGVDPKTGVERNPDHQAWGQHGRVEGRTLGAARS